MNTLEVWVNKQNAKPEKVAVIEPFKDPKHPRRKFCYRIAGGQRYYSETASSLNEMFAEYLFYEVDWAFCVLQGITIEIKPVVVEK